jgi:hypothetical protein
LGEISTGPLIRRVWLTKPVTGHATCGIPLRDRLNVRTFAYRTVDQQLFNAWHAVLAVAGISEARGMMGLRARRRSAAAQNYCRRRDSCAI